MDSWEKGVVEELRTCKKMKSVLIRELVRVIHAYFYNDLFYIY